MDIHPRLHIPVHNAGCKVCLEFIQHLMTEYGRNAAATLGADLSDHWHHELNVKTRVNEAYEDGCQNAEKAVAEHKAKAQRYRDENHSLRKEIETLKSQLESQAQPAPSDKGKERAHTPPLQLMDHDVQMNLNPEDNSVEQMTQTVSREYAKAAAMPAAPGTSFKPKLKDPLKERTWDLGPQAPNRLYRNNIPVPRGTGNHPYIRAGSMWSTMTHNKLSAVIRSALNADREVFKAMAEEAYCIPLDQRSVEQRRAVRVGIHRGILPGDMIEQTDVEFKIRSGNKPHNGARFSVTDTHVYFDVVDVAIWQFMLDALDSTSRKAAMRMLASGQYEHLIKTRIDDEPNWEPRKPAAPCTDEAELAQHLYGCGLTSDMYRGMFYDYARRVQSANEDPSSYPAPPPCLKHTAPGHTGPHNKSAGPSGSAADTGPSTGTTSRKRPRATADLEEFVKPPRRRKEKPAFKRPETPPRQQGPTIPVIEQVKIARPDLSDVHQHMLAHSLEADLDEFGHDPLGYVEVPLLPRPGITGESSPRIDYGEPPADLGSQPTFGATADTASTPVGAAPQGGSSRPAARGEDIVASTAMQIDEPESGPAAPAA